MTWLVEWNGREIDADPSEFTGLELSAIKLRTGFTYQKLLEAVGELDPDAIRAIFWTVDKRDDPDLKFSEYPGPTMKRFIPWMEGFLAAMEELGKAMPTPTPETAGSPSSPTPSDGTEPPTTG